VLKAVATGGVRPTELRRLTALRGWARVEREIGADEACDGNGCRSPRSSISVFDRPLLAGKTDLTRPLHSGTAPRPAPLE